MRRLRHLAMVLSFLLVLSDVGSHGFAREIRRKVHGVQSERRSSKDGSSSAASEAVVGVSVELRCKFNGVAGACVSIGKGEKKNFTMEEEKRVVPTGPNPLHNR